MRCRFCNKTLSLLRRLKDTDYCSEAHRHAFHAEQQMAFQRLVDSQAQQLSRTQRMAAAVLDPARVAPAAEEARLLGTENQDVAPGAPPAPVEGLEAPASNHGLPFGLWAGFLSVEVSRPSRIELDSEPYLSALPVVVCEHTHPFSVDLPFGDRIFAPATHPLLPPVESVRARPVLLNQTRILLPRPVTRPAPLVSRSQNGGDPPMRQSLVALSPPDLRKPHGRPRSGGFANTPSIAHPTMAGGWSKAHLRAVHRCRAIAVNGWNIAFKALSDLAPSLSCEIAKPARRGGFVLEALVVPPSARVDDEAPIWAHLSTSGLCALTAAVPLQPLRLPAVPMPVPSVPTNGETASAQRVVAGTFRITGVRGLAQRVPLKDLPELQPRDLSRSRSVAVPLDRILHPLLPEHRIPKPVRNVADTGCRRVPAPEAKADLKPGGDPGSYFRPEVDPWLPSRRKSARPALAVAGTCGITQHAALLSWNSSPGPYTQPAVEPSRPRAAKAAGCRLAQGPAVALCSVPDPKPATWKPRSPAKALPMLRLRLPRQRPSRERYCSEAAYVAIPAPQAALPAKSRLFFGALAGVIPAAVPCKTPIHAPGIGEVERRMVPLRNQPRPLRMSNHTAVLGPGDWGAKPAIVRSGIAADSRALSKGWNSGFERRIREAISLGKVGEVWSKVRFLPADLKWIAMAVPLVLGIWVFTRPSPSRPLPLTRLPSIALPAQRAAVPQPEGVIVPAAEESHVAAARADQKSANQPAKEAVRAVAAAGTGPWQSLQARLSERAAVDMKEDFQTGLSLWEGKGDWARTWSYDTSGLVRPGSLAVFQPSRGLTDYVFDMKASIERRSIQWVVRAKDLSNYHFLRLNVYPGSPQTRIEFERWTVVAGRAGRVTRAPLPPMSATQTLFTIRTEARSESITTYLDDVVVDTFNDRRLLEGGIGLAGVSGDRARIFGLQISHQNDLLGKLCSFLAPRPMYMQGMD